MTGKVRWGVLSTADIARRAVIPAMQHCRLAEVSAIASRDAGRAREAAQELGIPRAFGSYDELLRSPDVDAVYIAVPNHLHVEWCVRAIQAGKHVLCEKPLSISVGEVRKVIAARDRG